MAVLDEHRRALPDLPNRAETVRRLVEQALATQPTTNRKTHGRSAQRKNARSTL
jgi:hypothetical protein